MQRMPRGSRDQILDAARRVFARYGYDGATISRLEKEIGLSRGAIFHHFKDKLALFVELTGDFNRRYLDVLRERGFAATIREIAKENPDFLGVLIEVESRLRHDAEFRHRVHETQPTGTTDVEVWFSEQQENGRLRSDVSVRDLEQFVSLILHGLAIRIVAGDRINIDVVIRLVDDAIGGREGA
jgi:AcrR family transcriptional regulator